MLDSVKRLVARRRADRKAGIDRESDVAADARLAQSRATGGLRSDQPDAGATTGTGRNDLFVGRVAGDDVGSGDETGAEVRARRST